MTNAGFLHDRVLTYFPQRDAAIAGNLLKNVGMTGFFCQTMEQLCLEVERGAGVVLVTEEAIEFGNAKRLKSILNEQPPWSDLPVIVLTTQSVSSEIAVLAMERLGNVTLLERPISMKTLVSVLRTALKARRRQYQIRDYLMEKEKTAEQMAQYNKELEQFAYVSSHDLKEPLRKISMYAQLLHAKSRLAEDPEVRPWLDNIVNGAMRMNNLIEDLLAYSRIDRQESIRHRVDLNDIFRMVVSDLEASILAARAEVTSGLLPSVVGVRTQIRQVLQNLIANAIKFRGESVPLVHVSSAMEKGHAHVIVRDNGIGIDPRFREQIFHLFSRLHTPQRYPGTGLGLAICKKIVERHGGKIWVESQPNQGCSFHFTLATPRVELLSQPAPVAVS